MAKREHFPGWPSLKRFADTDRGRAELKEVNVTSDGFLLGYAVFGTGKNAYGHSILIGEAKPHIEARRQYLASQARQGAKNV